MSRFKTLVAVRFDGQCEVFEFPSKSAAQGFVAELRRKYKGKKLEWSMSDDFPTEKIKIPGGGR